jgi:MoxR-like ATPase
MKPSDLISLLTARFKAKVKRPVHVEGPPGGGKTQIAGQAANS